MSVNEILVKSFSNANHGKLGDMAAKIAMQNFEYRYATLLFFNSTFYYGVELFLHTFNYSVVINRGVINPNLARILRQYVIYGRDIADLEQLLDLLREFEVQNTGKFIVICTSRFSSKCDEKEMTKLFWEHKMVDAVIIKFEADEAVGFTYFPIADEDCNNFKPRRLKTSKETGRFTTNRGDIFGMKLKNLGLCPLYVSTFIQTPYMNLTNGTTSGADGDLLPVIAYGLNTTLKVMTPHRGDGWGFRLSNETWVGSLADVGEGLANISVTSAALTLSRFSDFQLSRSYYFSYVVWITHPAMEQNEALKLLHPFETSTRIALIVSYAFVILGALIVNSKKWSATDPNNPNVQFSRSIIFNSWLICMGQAVIKLPTKSALLQITLLWIYYCFLIRTAYQVYLISSLKGTFYEDQFESIEDAIKENYPFGGGLALRDYYIDHPEVYNGWVNIEQPEIKPTLLAIAEGKKFVLAMNMDTAKMMMKLHKINVHILPQKIVSSPAVIFFKKYSPLAESLNLVLSRIVTSGLPEKLHQVYTTIHTKKNANGEDLEPLEIIHFTACYAVLITGWIVSFLFFSVELYLGRIYKRPTFSSS